MDVSVVRLDILPIMTQEHGGNYESRGEYEVTPTDEKLLQRLHESTHIEPLHHDEIVYYGSLSPPARVTMHGDERKRFSIPEAAVNFAFAYPLTGLAEELKEIRERGGEPFVFEADEEEDEETVQQKRLAFDFLTIGGFLYWDDEGNVCHAAALSIGGQLHFADPVLVSEEVAGVLKDHLVNQMRLEPVTAESLYDAGMHHFCWVVPEEGLPGFKVCAPLLTLPWPPLLILPWPPHPPLASPLHHPLASLFHAPSSSSLWLAGHAAVAARRLPLHGTQGLHDVVVRDVPSSPRATTASDCLLVASERMRLLD